MDGAICVATALSGNHGLQHIKWVGLGSICPFLPFLLTLRTATRSGPAFCPILRNSWLPGHSAPLGESWYKKKPFRVLSLGRILEAQKFCPDFCILCSGYLLFIKENLQANFPTGPNSSLLVSREITLGNLVPGWSQRPSRRMLPCALLKCEQNQLLVDRAGRQEETQLEAFEQKDHF